MTDFLPVLFSVIAFSLPVLALAYAVLLTIRAIKKRRIRHTTKVWDITQRRWVAFDESDREGRGSGSNHTISPIHRNSRRGA